MKRLLSTAALLLAINLLSTGCRSCQSCHDYDSPVANCSCSQCGGGRAGSVMSSGGYTSEVMVEPPAIEYYEPTPAE